MLPGICGKSRSRRVWGWYRGQTIRSFGWGSSVDWGAKGLNVLLVTGSFHDGIYNQTVFLISCWTIFKRSDVVQHKKVFKSIVRICMDPPTCLPLYKCVNLRKGKEPICKLSGFLYPPNISCWILTSLAAWAFSTCGFHCRRMMCFHSWSSARARCHFFNVHPWFFRVAILKVILKDMPGILALV